jgi:hypothetical protein
MKVFPAVCQLYCFCIFVRTKTCLLSQATATNVFKTVPLPYADAFDRLYHVIVNTGHAVTLADPKSGMILFNSDVTAFDWGFSFTARLTSASPQATQIQFIGDPKFGFDLFNLGNKKIEQMMRYF